MTKNSLLKTGIAQSLPAIPEKKYFTIGEAATLCEVKPHVLRYWESEFACLNPSKRRGNRRYYQHKDVTLARQIRALLYESGFTIEGAKLQLSKTTRNAVNKIQADDIVQNLIADLEQVLQDLKV